MRTVLQECYPSADFSDYFRHLECCKTVKSPSTNEHHICPAAQFPEYEECLENLITLTVENHAVAHALLEAACGIKSPSTLFFEMQRNSASKGGVAGAIVNRKNGTGVYSRAVQSLGGKASCAKHEHQALAGRAGGQSKSLAKIAASCANFRKAARMQAERAAQRKENVASS